MERLMRMHRPWARMAAMPIAASCVVSGWVARADGPSATAAAAIPGATFRAADTLAVGEEQRADARDCLDGLCWEPREFGVTIEDAADGQGDLRVRFPSPVTDGPDCIDEVWLEWYQARDARGVAAGAPACVVVHESGSTMRVGRLVARGLALHGVHAFMVQLPCYGERKPPDGRSGVEGLLPAVRQAVADVRRARDAVAALPPVDAGRIAVQGTSLGGFITATVAGIDTAYDQVFIFLAGGDIAGVLETGKHDAARIRELALSRLSEAELRGVLRAIEPMRLAHRIRPERTWLYSARHDEIVPPANSRLLADAIGLPADHHVEMQADHYSGIVYLPVVLGRMATEIRGIRSPDTPGAAPAAD